MSIASAAHEQTSEIGVNHLVEILDRQPACLLRVALDGTLLAANDVALALLGADSGADVLERPFADRFLPGQAGLWQEFCARVWKSGSGSVECDLTDLRRTIRPVNLRAIARREHPDGTDSLLLTIRDAAATRRLEEAAQEAARVQELAASRAGEIDTLRQEIARLSSALQAAVSDVARLSSELAALRETFRVTSLLAQQLADAARLASPGPEESR